MGALTRLHNYWSPEIPRRPEGHEYPAALDPETTDHHVFAAQAKAQSAFTDARSAHYQALERRKWNRIRLLFGAAGLGGAAVLLAVPAVGVFGGHDSTVSDANVTRRNTMPTVSQASIDCSQPHQEPLGVQLPARIMVSLEGGRQVTVSSASMDSELTVSPPGTPSVRVHGGTVVGGDNYWGAELTEVGGDFTVARKADEITVVCVTDTTPAASVGANSTVSR